MGIRGFHMSHTHEAWWRLKLTSQLMPYWRLECCMVLLSRSSKHRTMEVLPAISTWTRKFKFQILTLLQQLSAVAGSCSRKWCLRTDALNLKDCSLPRGALGGLTRRTKKVNTRVLNIKTTLLYPMIHHTVPRQDTKEYCPSHGKRHCWTVLWKSYTS